MKNASRRFSGNPALHRTSIRIAVPLLIALAGQQAVAQNAGPTGDERTLPAVTVTAPTVPTGVTEGTGSYTTESMSTATRLNLSPRETPQSVGVVTRQQMDDLNILSVEDMVTYTTGLTLNRGATERASFYSRGFPISFFTEDGLPIVGDGDTLGFATLAMYDRVEVLRGAAGMLTGAGQPSGTLNFVRKRPTAAPQFSANASIGRWNNYRTQVDASGPLNEAKTLRGRTVVAYQDTDTFISNYGHKRALIYATAEADLTRDTTLSVGFHRNEEKNAGSTWFGMPTARNGEFLPLDRSANNSPDWAYWDKTNTRVFAELEQRFANRWKLKLAAQTRRDELDAKLTQVVRQGTSELFRLSDANDFTYDRRQHAFDVQASGPFSLLGRTHEIVVGANHRTRDIDDFGLQPVTPFSYIFDPVNWDTGATQEPDTSVYYWGNKQKTRQTSIYTTTRFQVLDPLAVMVGARVDRYKHDNSGFSLTATPQNTSSGYKISSEVTPYAGIVYDLNDTYSVYGSYTSIFNPQTATDPNGNTLKPAEGINTEAGIKAAYFGGALNVSAAIFRMKQQNLATSLLASECNGQLSCSEAAGEVESKGFELEVAGSVTPSWQLSAGYTYNSSEYTKQTGRNFTPGTPYAPERPRRLLRLATSYKLPGELNQWRIGGAVRSQSEIYKTTNAIRQGGYTLVDVLAAYQVNRHWDLRFNVSNLFDKKYYQTIGSVDSGNLFGEPRNFTLTANYKF